MECKTDQAKEVLNRIQTNQQKYQLDIKLANMEKEALKTYKFWANIALETIKQTSKFEWDTKGDENSAFFHNVV